MTEIFRNIADPDPSILRAQFRNQYAAGDRTRTGCPHPVSAIQFYEDVRSYRDKQGRPTNLCVCTICNTPGRMVMFDEVEAKDG